MEILDLKKIGVRGVNSTLHDLSQDSRQNFEIQNPQGQHSIACGLDAPLIVEIKGHVGFYCGGMNKFAKITITGHAGVGLAENMMSGNIVVGGSVGHMSGFMAQSGNLVICGDAGEALGDSIYETKIFVRGEVSGLGADCIEKEMTPEHFSKLSELLESSGLKADPADFRRYGSARKLYNFDIDNADAY